MPNGYKSPYILKQMGLFNKPICLSMNGLLYPSGINGVIQSFSFDKNYFIRTRASYLTKS